jgi:hypothetical protein
MFVDEMCDSLDFLDADERGVVRILDTGLYLGVELEL